MRSGSPLYVNPLVGPSLWSWLLRFASGCHEEHMIRAGTARNALLQSSMTLYKELVATHALKCEWQDKGLLVVYQHAKDMDAALKEDRLMREHWGVGATAP